MPMDVWTRLAPPAAPEDAPITTAAGMLFACWAIVIVLAAMAAVFMSSGKREYAVGILPLILPPAVHIVSGVIARFLDPLLPLDGAQLRIIIDLLAGLLGCLLIGFSSRNIKERKSRNAFLIACSGFIMILTLVLIVNTMTLAS